MSHTSQKSEIERDSLADTQPVAVTHSDAVSTLRFRWIRAHAAQLSVLLALVAFALMVAAALDFRPVNTQRYLASGALKMILGALALGAALRLAALNRSLPVLPMPLNLPLSAARRMGWLFAGVGVLMLALLAEINSGRLMLPALKEVSTHAQYWLLLGGIAFLTYGLAGAPAFPRSRLKIDWRGLLPLAAILALALFLRVWNLDGTLRILIDELHWSDAIMAVEGRPTLRLLSPMSAQSPYTWLFP